MSGLRATPPEPMGRHRRDRLKLGRAKVRVGVAQVLLLGGREWRPRVRTVNAVPRAGRVLDIGARCRVDIMSGGRGRLRR